MISVLICSTNTDLFKQVTQNITESIGTAFEILHFNNKLAKKGICAVYNQLAKEAQYSILCFVHEDVMFKTAGWGEILLKTFLESEQVGLVGIAGSKYKSRYYSGWFTNLKTLDCASYIHQYPGSIEHVRLTPDNSNAAQEVVCIDGVFMCCRKNVWKENPFDDQLLKGFHFYDIDFSLRIAQKNEVLVIYDLELIHITSGGDYGNAWVTEAIKYHLAKQNELPFSKILVDNAQADKKIIKAGLDFLKNYKIALGNKIAWIHGQKLYSDPVFYYSIIKFLVYKPLGLKRIHKLFRL
jgi:Glycosyltransferase like family